MPATAPSCADCDYFRAPPAAQMLADPVHAPAYAAAQRGVCRRFPQDLPKLSHEWCGEFRLSGELQLSC